MESSESSAEEMFISQPTKLKPKSLAKPIRIIHCAAVPPPPKLVLRKSSNELPMRDSQHRAMLAQSMSQSSRRQRIIESELEDDGEDGNIIAGPDEGSEHEDEYDKLAVNQNHAEDGNNQPTNDHDLEDDGYYFNQEEFNDTFDVYSDEEDAHFNHVGYAKSSQPWEEQEEQEDNRLENGVTEPPRKRGAPPLMSLESVQVTKHRQRESNSSRKNLRACDLEVILKNLVKMAQPHYRCLICTVFGFPELQKNIKFASSSWQIAGEIKHVSVELDEDLLKLITERGPQVRGKLKRIAGPIVEFCYALAKVQHTNKEAIRKVREKVEDLLEKAAYLYKDPEAQKGPYLHPAFLQIICRMWFNNKNDEGVLYPEYFSPGITLPTVALIVTVVENVLDEYSEGYHTPKAFTEAEYGDRYDEHLKDLQDWEALNPDFIRKWLKQLLVAARGRIGLSDGDVAPQSCLSRNELEAAAAELGDDDLEALVADFE